MKIQASEIEFVFEEEEFSNPPMSVKHHVLQFVKTPRGRSKNLLTISEESTGTGKLVRIDVNLDGADSTSERRKLLSALVRGSFKSQTRLNPKTLDLLQLPMMSGTYMLSMNFA